MMAVFAKCHAYKKRPYAETGDASLGEVMFFSNIDQRYIINASCVFVALLDSRLTSPQAQTKSWMERRSVHAGRK